MSDSDQLARRAYRAYGEVTGGKNYQGKPMPAWEDLGSQIQQAWRVAAQEVVTAFLDAHPAENQ